MTKDKERDDAMIDEKNRLAADLERMCSGEWLAGADAKFRRIAVLLRGDEQPKPDRAEALAWMIEGLFAEAADNPCTCASDENSCPHCNAWERATKQTRACIVEAIDELRAEWEAERPVIEVPIQVKAWAEGIGSVIPPTDEVREWIKSLPIGATDRSPRSRLHRLEM